MLDGVLQSFLFGVTLAGAVGPIALLIINYGVTRGLRTAISAALGAALADLSYALVAFTIGSVILGRLEEHGRALRTLSAVVLIALGLYVVARALKSARDPEAAAARGDAARPLATTYLLTLFNPMTVVFFATFAAQLPLASRIAAVPFAFSLALGSGSIGLVYALGGATLSRLISRPSWIRMLNIGSGAAITVFGILGLLRRG